MDLKITPSGQTIVKPTALGPGANTDTKLLIYGLFQKGPSFGTGRGHGQNNIAIFASDVEVAQHVIRDIPDEVGDPVESASLQAQTLPICLAFNIGPPRFHSRPVPKLGPVLSKNTNELKTGAPGRRRVSSIIMMESATIKGLATRLCFWTRRGSLVLRPGDSLTILKMALSVSFIRLVSSTNVTQATGR